MRFKRFLLALLFCLFVFSCKEDLKTVTSNIPDSIKNVIRNVPEDVLIGIGVAITESDGEAMLLAENRAREEIARQLSTLINDTTRNYENNDIWEESLIEAYSITKVASSKVIRRERDKNGNWWCVVAMIQKESKPNEGDLFNIFRSNMTKSFDITNVRTVAEIPEWVWDSYGQLPEDVFCGIGAARLNNDEDSILLAKERARRSLAHSLSTDVTSAVFSFIVNNTEPYYDEEITSNTSVYNHTPIQTQLLNLAKTKDGTWWVMLGCFISTKETDIIIPPGLSTFDAEERMNEAFNRLQNNN